MELAIPHPRFAHRLQLPRGWVPERLSDAEAAAAEPGGFTTVSACVLEGAPVAFVVAAAETVTTADLPVRLAQLAAREQYRLEPPQVVALPAGNALVACAQPSVPETGNATCAWICLVAAHGDGWSLMGIAPHALFEACVPHFESLARSFEAGVEPPAAAPAPGPAPEPAVETAPASLPSAEPFEVKDQEPPELRLVEPVQHWSPELEDPGQIDCVRITRDASHMAFQVLGGSRPGIWVGYNGTHRSNVRIASLPGRCCSELRWSPSGRHLACRTAANELVVIDRASREIVFECATSVWAWQPQDPRRALGLVPLQREVLWFVSRGPEELASWNSARPSEVAVLCPAKGAESLAPAPDGTRVAWIARQDDQVRVAMTSAATAASRRLSELDAHGQSRLFWSPDGKRLGCASAAAPGAPGRVVELDLANGSSRMLAKRTRTFAGLDAVWLPDNRSIAFLRDAGRDLQNRPSTAARLHVVDADTGTELATAAFVADPGELSLIPHDRIACDGGTCAHRIWFRGPLGDPRPELDDTEAPIAGTAPLPSQASWFAEVRLDDPPATLSLPRGWTRAIPPLPGTNQDPAHFAPIAAFVPPAGTDSEARITLLRCPLPPDRAVVDILAAAHAALGFDERLIRDHDDQLDSVGTSQTTPTFRRMRTLLLEDAGVLYLLVAECADAAWYELQRTLAHALLSFRLTSPQGRRIRLDRDGPRARPAPSRPG